MLEKKAEVVHLLPRDAVLVQYLLEHVSRGLYRARFSNRGQSAPEMTSEMAESGPLNAKPQIARNEVDQIKTDGTLRIMPRRCS